MTLVTNYNQPAIEFLYGRMGGVEVTGPRELPTKEQAGVLDPICIVQAAGGPNPLQPPMRAMTYTIRCYADSDDGALALYGALQAACVDNIGWPVANVLVLNRWWLYDVALGGPAGPTPDPEAAWAVIAATATMTWSMLEVE